MATRSSPSKQTSWQDARILNGTGPSVWHRSAPAAVRRAYCAGDAGEGWAAFRAHLATRKRPLGLDELLPGEGEPLSWALPDGLHTHPRPAWLDRAERLLGDGRPAGKSLERELLCWLGESAGGAVRLDYALGALACCHAITRLPEVLSPDVWWALLDHLLCTVTDAAGLSLDEDPLVHQLLGGELPFTLAYLLPEIAPCRRLRSAARRALSSGPVDLLDGEGLPHGKHLAVLRPLMACWTRCRAMGEELGGSCFNEAAGLQYEWLVRQALRLSRHDGTHVFSDGPAGSFSQQMFETALAFGGDVNDRKIASLVLPGRKKIPAKQINRRRLPEPAVHSEWAATAVLRPEWSRLGERLTVVYPGGSMGTELACDEDVLWSGPWEVEVRLDGRPALPTSDWEEICWVSDDDVDYLELEIELSGGLSMQRQILLARKDHFALLADVVLGDRQGSLEYQGCLPLCPDVAFRQAAQSREGYLMGSGRRALVLPLALPEWKARQGVGELVQTGRGLELWQSAEARRLYAPLFFDFDRRRMTRRPTWRRLTVAESLAIQPAEVAVGYRVAVGKRQWLIYRSLAEKANRTLLGHNLSTEMLVANFDRCGEVEPLIEIE